MYSDEESNVNGQNEKRVFWQASINDKRPQLKVRINNKVISGLVNTGADVTIILKRLGLRNGLLERQMYNCQELGPYLEFEKVLTQWSALDQKDRKGY